MNKVKYVYLIKSLEDGYYKIGVSIHPNKRVCELNVGNSSQLKLIGMFKSDFADKIERTLQRRYEHMHKVGEWFDMSITEEVNFEKSCRTIEESLLFLKKSGNVFI